MARLPTPPTPGAGGGPAPPSAATPPGTAARSAPPAPAGRAERNRGYRLANAVSYGLNPLVFPPIAFALIEAHFGGGPASVAWTFGVSLVFFCLVPLAYVAGMVRAGRAESLEVRDRASRVAPLGVGIASYAVGALLLWRTVEGPALPLIVAFASLYPVNTAVLLLVNLRWKISLHMSSLAGFVGVLLFVALTVWRDLPADVEVALTLATVGPLVLLVPLLMWARVRVGAHTPGQVMAGAFFGLVGLPAELWWVTARWLDLVG